MTAIYYPDKGVIVEQPEPERTKRFEELKDYETELKEYRERLVKLRTIPCHESARSLWKDGQKVEEGKDYEVKFVQCPDHWLLVESFNCPDCKHVAFPLPVKSEEGEEERVSWPGVLLEIHDKCRSHKNELGCQHPGLPSDEEFLRQLIDELKQKYIITKR